MEEKHPTYANGKICYLEIPALSIEVSAAFYGKAFGWKIRSHDDGSCAFDDGVGEVSGMWVLGQKPMTEPGIIISIMVDDADVTSELIASHGGKIVKSFKTSGEETIVHFLDPAGNFMGLYQSSPRS